MVQTARDRLNLHITQRWPEAEFHIVVDAGHFHTEPGIQARLIEATDTYKTL